MVLITEIPVQDGVFMNDLTEIPRNYRELRKNPPSNQDISHTEPEIVGNKRSSPNVNPP